MTSSKNGPISFVFPSRLHYTENTQERVTMESRRNKPLFFERGRGRLDNFLGYRKRMFFLSLGYA